MAAAELLTSSMLRTAKKTYASALAAFAKSTSNFEVLQTYPQARAALRPRSLYVLDSSFNPPTTAHLRIALSALHNDSRGTDPKRLMLLLATQNADKGTKPAPFEDRLVMMTLMAADAVEQCNASLQSDLAVDVAVTKKPFFHDKAAAIDESRVYGDEIPEQIHLLGFDTIIRMFNTKYYPPEHTLAPLEPFFSKHRLRMTYRPDNGWDGAKEQQKYVQDIADGHREHEGGKKEWAKQIDLVEGKREGEETISSTKAREAAKAQSSGLEKYVSPSVREWIASERLYIED
ncbi:MAG: hypothetical protein Q9227_000723 [Pyrenula ochraceoflavens]